MAEARRRDAWDRTASLEAYLVLVMTGKKVRPADFHPFYSRSKRLRATREEWSGLKDEFEKFRRRRRRQRP